MTTTHDKRAERADDMASLKMRSADVRYKTLLFHKSKAEREIERDVKTLSTFLRKITKLEKYTIQDLGKGKFAQRPSNASTSDIDHLTTHERPKLGFDITNRKAQAKYTHQNGTLNDTEFGAKFKRTGPAELTPMPKIKFNSKYFSLMNMNSTDIKAQMRTNDNPLLQNAHTGARDSRYEQRTANSTSFVSVEREANMGSGLSDGRSLTFENLKVVMQVDKNILFNGTTLSELEKQRLMRTLYPAVSTYDHRYRYCTCI